MSYALIKHIHMACAALSGLFFLVRGVWMWSDSAMLRGGFVRVAPHVIDTLLLISAVTLVAMSGQYPFQHTWVTAKLVALVVYIALGTIALKRGKTKSIRAMAFVVALATFAYIVSVAVTKQPIPFV